MSAMNKVFLSGKIEGASQREIGRFYTAEALLIKQGIEVFNSAKSNNEERWQIRFSKYLSELESCKSVLMIQGYKFHTEPNVLMKVAKDLGIKIDFQPAVGEDELNRLVKVIQHVIGINNLKSKSREIEYTAARAIMANYCRMSLDMHRNNIGPVVGREPGSIYNMLISYDNWMETWPKFRNWVKQFKMEI